MRAGFNDLTTRILGPNSLVQAAVVEILEKTPQSYFDGVMNILSVFFCALFNFYLNYFYSRLMLKLSMKN